MRCALGITLAASILSHHTRDCRIVRFAPGAGHVQGQQTRRVARFTLRPDKGLSFEHGSLMESDEERAKRHERERKEANERYDRERREEREEAAAKQKEEREEASRIRKEAHKRHEGERRDRRKRD